MKKVAIIGGGPIGLKTYIELSKLNLKVNLFEANKILGGQLTSLYPLKQVNDLIDVPSCTAREVINSLIKNINQNDVFLNTEITSIDQINGKFKLNLNDD
ncbi:MAG: FAD-dependent oxidoreductase, partial [Bacilli bacterium]